MHETAVTRGYGPDTPIQHNSHAIYQVLPSGAGYIDLTRLEIAQVDAAMDKVKDAPSVIFDLRGYPKDTGVQIAPRLAQSDTPFAVAQFRRPILSAAPDSVSFSGFSQMLTPATPSRGIAVT